MRKDIKADLIALAAGFALWLIGEICIRQVIEPSCQAFCRIGLIIIAAVLTIGVAETIKNYQEEKDEK